jgi:hypothetical protein
MAVDELNGGVERATTVSVNVGLEAGRVLALEESHFGHVPLDGI